MGAVATFNYTTWVTRYPEFSFVSADLAGLYFTEAALYWRNDGTIPVCDAATQLMVLNMLTAHIAALNAAKGSTQPATTLVGRISSASEGSVSVQAESDYPPGTPQWYQQTKYGSAFWAATAAFRTFRYAPQVGRGVGGAFGAASVPGRFGGGPWRL